MPKSRKRRVRPRPVARQARTEGSQLTELWPYLALMARADAAERGGDAMGALQIMDERPYGPDGRPFWRPERVNRLLQLAALSPLLPPWAVSRWILAQSLQVWGDSGNARMLRALELAVAARPGGECGLPAVDASDARAKVVDHDWIFRQVALYELGGLAAFLRTAPADLLSGADHIREWAAAPMAAFRLLGSDSLTVTWEDLASGRRTSIDNIGSAVLALPGECVLGRLVPVSTRSGWMFESAPLVVEGTVAQAVAEAPRDWLDLLTSALLRDEPPMSPRGFEFGMLQDVPNAIWLQVLLDGHGSVVPEARELARALLDLVAAELAGTAPRRAADQVDLWPCVSAALLSSSVLGGLLEVVEPTDLPALSFLSAHLPEPAARLCTELYDGLRAREEGDCA